MKLLQQQMQKELKEKTLFAQAQNYAYNYIDSIEEMDVFPSKESLDNLTELYHPMPIESSSASVVLEQLNRLGSPTTIAQTGGRYFGFVNGGALPVTLGTKWLSDVWDQCGGLFLTSPINAHMETICENWLKDIFKLPNETVAGFVSGGSMANLCGLAAARFRLLNNVGWDINKKGLAGSPPIRIITHEQIHASIKKTLTLLGFGTESIEWVAADDQGRMQVDQLPELDNRSLLILQAGNANTGSFDHFEVLCKKANKAGAWVHVDGAFGLWAAATGGLAHLTKGVQKANSWAVDGHKTLNTPYDSGIVLCSDPDAMISALQATGEYIIYSEQRDPLLYTPELSKRSRAIELWAALKYLGKEGIDKMVMGFHERAKQLEDGLKEIGLDVINEVVFNQVLVRAKSDNQTKAIIQQIQTSGKCWLGGSTWKGQAVIRVSISSWMTTEKDINQTIELFAQCLQ